METSLTEAKPADTRDVVIPVPDAGAVNVLFAVRLDDGRLFELSARGDRETMPMLVEHVGRQFAAWADKFDGGR